MRLGLVHRQVGIANQVFRGFTIFRINRDTDTDGRNIVLLCHGEGLLEFSQHFLGNHDDVFGIVDVRQQYREFIAALTCQRISGTQAIADSQGKILQQLVTLRVTIGVVNQLESIKVEEHDTDPLIAPLGLGKRQFKPIHEQGAVGQSGQKVVKCLEIDGFFGTFTFGDVPCKARCAKEALLRDALFRHVNAL